MGSLVKCPQRAQDIRQLIFANVQPSSDQSWGVWVSFPQSYTLGKVHSPSRNDRVKSLKIFLCIQPPPLSLSPTRHFLRTDLFLAKKPEFFSRGRPQGISVETGWLKKLVALGMSFLVLYVLLRWFWVSGGNHILHTPSLTMFFGPTLSYQSGTLREIEGDFWVICLSFTVTEPMWLQGSILPPSRVYVPCEL